MGKYALTRASQGKSWNPVRSAGNSGLNMPQSEGDYKFQSFLYSFDPSGLYRGYVDARDRTAYMRDYLKNRGMKWSDIKYPSMTAGFGGYSVYGRAALNVSKNIYDLYG